jgi:hypothetical protein
LEKIQIKYDPSVEKYLNDLVDILFEQEYFGFKESAQKYVREIMDNAEFGILNFTSKITPFQLQHLGKYYVSYPTKNRTTWYIFFSKFEHRILIKYITNNHVEHAKFLEHF